MDMVKTAVGVLLVMAFLPAIFTLTNSFGANTTGENITGISQVVVPLVGTFLLIGFAVFTYKTSKGSGRY